MTKSAEAFRTISEVAEELELQKHVLRFWEVKFPQIKPMKRGGGRRYYRPTDLELLRGIRHLLHAEGYTIKGVQRIIREKGVDAVKRSAGTASDAVANGNGDSDDGGAAALVAAKATVRGAAAKSKAARGAGKTLTPAHRKAIVSVIEELQTCRDELTSEDAPIAVAGSAPNRSVG